MDKLIDDTLERLRVQNVRGMFVFMDDDADFYSASSALDKKEANRLLLRAVRDESQRQSIPVPQLLNDLLQLNDLLERV